jgi:acyl transferase domain-containing protein/acyl carrier protein
MGLENRSDARSVSSPRVGRSKMGTTEREPIAIIGIGCRFPSAKGPEAFWHLLREGVDAITEIPSDRFDVGDVYDPKPGMPGKLNTKWGGFLEGVDEFDPFFFGISSREATAMDPQQRVLLEVAWEAIEDAGLVPEKLDVGRTGVFAGTCNSDYGNLLEDPADIDIYVAGGNALSVLSGRLSYALGLQGPSMTVDTACSTSLVAVHLACQSLWSGESTVALAGGVNLIFGPEPYIAFSRAQMLAPDGRCKFGDSRADGFVRSEGAGVVVLKQLPSALADGDPVYAVIRGSAVNNDGDSGGLLMTPSRPGQEAVFKEAYRSAGVSPGEVQYVEAHGTGTSVGDPVEMQALGAVIGERRPDDHPCLVGSVKTNIGHTEGAAGVAGLIKTALALKHKTIPPSLHLREPNPNIPWQNLPLTVQRELSPWPASPGLARAGVSSFGISGTNAHVVLEEAPEAPPSEAEATATAHLLPLSAHSPEALEDTVRAYAGFLRTEEGAVSSLQDVCYTAGARRTHHAHRLALVGSSREQLAEQLEAFLEGESRPGMSSGRKLGDLQRKLVFVFSGQGSQWVGMGRELLEQEPAFREAMERCDRAIRRYTGWSMLEELAADEAHSRLSEVDVVQPAIFVVQVSLAVLWRSWGVEPDAVVGQSLGEVAAAHVAGALTLEDATRVICRRSQLVKRTSGHGSMAVAQLSLEEAERAISGREGRVSVAVNSSPYSTVLSGEVAALEEVLTELECQDVFCRRIRVDYASHSPQVDPLRPDLLEALEGIRPRSSSVPLYSTVTGEIENGRALDAAYWVRNLRQPVLFSTAVERLLEDGHDVFVEVSPHPVLLSAVEQCLRHHGREGITLPSLRENEGREAPLGSFGTLYTLGHPVVDWDKLYSSSSRCVGLPSYRWQGEHFWLPDQDSVRNRNSRAHPNGRGRLLGLHLRSAADPGTHHWETSLGVETFGYLGDHRVQGLAVLPAAAFAGMVLSAAEEALGSGDHTLEDMSFEKALFLPEEGIRAVQLVLSARNVGETSFRFFSLEESATQEDALWTPHAAGRIRHHYPDSQTNGYADPAVRHHESPEELMVRCLEIVSGADLYEGLRDRGLEYGPSFQGVEQLWRRDGEALGQLQLTETVATQKSGHKIHPALLDACFQVLAAALPKGSADGDDLYLPVGLARLRLHDLPDAELWAHALLRSDALADANYLEGDVFLLDESGQVLLEASGLRLQRLERDVRRENDQEDLDSWLYEVRWEPKVLLEQDEAPGPPSPDQRASWLIFTDAGGVGQALQKLLEEHDEACVSVSSGDEYWEEGPGCYRLNPANPEHFRRLLADLTEADFLPLRGVAYVWGVEANPPKDTVIESLEEARALGCTGALHLVQALTTLDVPPRLWLVTRGTQPVGDEPVSVDQAPLWGLGKVISLEHPEFACTKVDLGSSDGLEEVQSLFRELWVEVGEDQIALRGGERYYVPRVVRCSPEAFDERRNTVSTDEPFRLEVSKPGILDEMTLRETGRKEPGHGEVEIQVRAVGLNFRDVLIAMDLIPPLYQDALDVGFECVGEIVAVGAGVESLEVGDSVIAFAPGCLSSFVTTDASFVMPKPAHLSFEEAATLPIAFFTAHYALNRLGRLAEGERILIHAAAGGVGQAAVRIAQRAGAEIFATAGSPGKREFLRSLGIHHVMDSRSVNFADEVMELTGGEGVDVVLNSLAGEFIPKSLSTLRSGGRFLEIGKVDFLQHTRLDLSLLKDNISFFAIDLSEHLLKRPDLSKVVLREALQFFEEGSLEPLPFKTFPISRAVDAFRYMAQAKHIGKVVVSLDEDEVSVVPSTKRPAVSSDGTYLVTGGAGGLGLSTAEWLVEQGARYLLLTGRSGAASEAARQVVAKMSDDGVRVVVAKADVSDEHQVAGVIEEIRHSMPPLRGVFHAAGILDDGVLLQLDEERFAKVMAPKVSGAWNLHRLTLEDDLDFFVLFSSAASVLGSPGQGNYVAANAFLDALAHHRRALGMPALAINWGAWTEVGLATRSDRVEHLTRQGIMPFTPEQGVRLMERMLERDVVQCMGVAMDWGKLLGSYTPPVLSKLSEEVLAGDSPTKKESSVRKDILATEPEERRRLVERFLVEQIAQVLKCSPTKVDAHQPLNRLGIDSLMAVELKNRVEADLETSVPVTALLQGPSLSQLATQLLEGLDASAAAVEAPLTPDEEAEDGLEAQVEELTDEEVDALLRDLVEDEEKAEG